MKRTMNYILTVTLSGIKGFFRKYRVNGATSLYTLHKQIRADLEFPQDQLIMFKALNASEGVVARYGLFDLGSGTVDQTSLDKVERFDKRIEELAADSRYAQKVKMLSCFIGIRTHTALALVVETGDFRRFAKAEQYAAFLGLVPGEHSSGCDNNHLGITKAGNSHLRRLLVESAQCLARGRVGYKSKALKAKQYGNPAQVIAYADRANERLRRKFYHLTLKLKKKRNIAIAAVARELSCFIWGMMTEHIA